MKSLLVLLATLAVSLAGACEKKKGAAAPPPRAAETVAADGTRSVPINVNDDGYDPSKIRAKPGEKLDLVFTRQTKAMCGAQVKVADGPTIDLPIGQAVTVAVTTPKSGEVRFACGMDMMTGIILVE